MPSVGMNQRGGLKMVAESEDLKRQSWQPGGGQAGRQDQGVMAME